MMKRRARRRVEVGDGEEFPFFERLEHELARLFGAGRSGFCGAVRAEHGLTSSTGLKSRGDERLTSYVIVTEVETLRQAILEKIEFFETFLEYLEAQRQKG